MISEQAMRAVTEQGSQAAVHLYRVKHSEDLVHFDERVDVAEFLQHAFLHIKQLQLEVLRLDQELRDIRKR